MYRPNEVYGTLSASDPAFRETNAFQHNSPYAASKAASDHLVRAWHHTYGLPVITTKLPRTITGPFSFRKSLIPLMIHNAIRASRCRFMETGCRCADWLHVEDHCTAIRTVLHSGELGETYNVGGN